MTAKSINADRAQSMADLSDATVFDRGIPHAVFAQMRAARGLTWNPTDDGGEGFWSVGRFEDVAEVSRDAKTYSSAVGHIQIYNIDDDALSARASMIDMDPPEHTRLRRLVSRDFLPTAIKSYEPTIRERIETSLDHYLSQGGGDWVDAISKPIPIGIICDLLGVPVSDRELMIELTDHLVAGTSARPLDPGAYGNTTPLRLLPFNSPAAHALSEYAVALGRQRRANPKQDLVSMLVDVKTDGECLSEADFSNFFRLLIFAGNETTRTAISHLALLMTKNPGAFQQLYDDPTHLDSAVEEVIRYASPILYFRRTATRDAILAGTQILAGQRVVMWYASANFDETQFEDPLAFEITRPKPRKHAGFGGGGVHICLGAWLARLELRVLLEALSKRRIQFRCAADPEYVSSNFVNGIERLDLEPV